MTLREVDTQVKKCDTRHFRSLAGHTLTARFRATRASKSAHLTCPLQDTAPLLTPKSSGRTAERSSKLPPSPPPFRIVRGFPPLAHTYATMYAAGPAAKRHFFAPMTVRRKITSYAHVAAEGGEQRRVVISAMLKVFEFSTILSVVVV